MYDHRELGEAASLPMGREIPGTRDIMDRADRDQVESPKAIHIA